MVRGWVSFFARSSFNSTAEPGLSIPMQLPESQPRESSKLQGQYLLLYNINRQLNRETLISSANASSQHLHRMHSCPGRRAGSAGVTYESQEASCPPHLFC